VLFDSVQGLFLLDDNDTITRLEPRDSQYMRWVAALPWSDEVIAVGAMDTILRNDLTLQSIGNWQSSRLVGVFPSIESAAVEVGATGKPIKLIRREGSQYRRVDTALSNDDIGFIVDAPWFGGPIVGDRTGLHLMDRDGRLSRFEMQNNDVRGFNPWAVSAFVVDRFRTIYVRSREWHRITSDRRWLPVPGLPQDAFVNDTFDPGSGDVLLATSKGMFALDPEGRARPIGDDRGRARFRSLARSPGDNAVLAGGAEGLFRISLGTYEMLPVANGSKDMIGDVRQITESASSDFAIVAASNGTYALTPGGLEVIRDLAAPSNASTVFVFKSLHRMLVTERGDKEPVLYDIGRRDPSGTCRRAN
jgi:hypothetical protein